MRTIQQETRMSSRIGIAMNRFDPSLNISKKKSTKSKIKTSRLPRKRKSCCNLKEPKRSEYIPKEENELELQLPVNPKVGLYPSPANDDYNFVDDIVARRQTIKGQWEFKVRYLGWDSKCDNWQPWRYLNDYCRRVVYERYTNIKLPPVHVLPEQLRQVQQEMDEVKRVTDKRNEGFRKRGLPFNTVERNGSDDDDTQASLGNNNLDHSEMDYIQDSGKGVTYYAYNDDDESMIAVWSARGDYDISESRTSSPIQNDSLKMRSNEDSILEQKRKKITIITNLSSIATQPITESSFTTIEGKQYNGYKESSSHKSVDHHYGKNNGSCSEQHQSIKHERDEEFRNQAIPYYTIDNNRHVDDNASPSHKNCHSKNENVLPKSHQLVKQVKVERERFTDEGNEDSQRQGTRSTAMENNHYNGNNESSSSNKSVDHHIGKNNVPSNKQQHQSIKQEMYETTKMTYLRDERKQILPFYIRENNFSVDNNNKASSSHKSLDCHSEKDNVSSEPYQLVKQAKDERNKLTDKRNDDLQQHDVPFAVIASNKELSSHEGLNHQFGKKIVSAKQQQPLKQEIVEIKNAIDASIKEIQKQAIHFQTNENNSPDNYKSSSSRLYCHSKDNNNVLHNEQQFFKHARLTDERNEDLRQPGVSFSSSFRRENVQYDDNKSSSSHTKSMYHHSDKHGVQNLIEEVGIDDNDDESIIEVWSVHDGDDSNESKKSSHLQNDSVNMKSNASIEKDQIRNKTSLVTNMSETTTPEHIPITTTMEAPAIMESLNNLHNKLNNLHNLLEKAGFCCDPAPRNNE